MNQIPECDFEPATPDNAPTMDPTEEAETQHKRDKMGKKKAAHRNRLQNRRQKIASTNAPHQQKLEDLNSKNYVCPHFACAKSGRRFQHPLHLIHHLYVDHSAHCVAQIFTSHSTGRHGIPRVKSNAIVDQCSTPAEFTESVKELLDSTLSTL